jgi:hypothetical protein
VPVASLIEFIKLTTQLTLFIFVSWKINGFDAPEVPVLENWHIFEVAK